MRRVCAFLLGTFVFAHSVPAALSAPHPEPAPRNVKMRWAVKIPLRDGVRLSATAYTPGGQTSPAPCIFTLTPYTGENYHDRGVYFAAHGLPFLTVDVRGRGNSEGMFTPNLQEAKDGYDVVEWLARQPYCNGKVAMWGGSYAGYDQWATAKENPPHLATIVPAAAPYIGADFPMSNNIAQPYALQWLLYTGGKTLQEKIFDDADFWSSLWLDRFRSGSAFVTLGQEFGFNPPALHEWISHPELGPYWDAYNPTDAQYRALSIPILTITGSYDGDQKGALTHYRNFMRVASPEQRARHYLIIGPWDHAGTRTPRAEVAGLKFGPASLVDLPKLHVEWYHWTMADGQRPEFLQKPVAYYVMGAETWRYADTLEGVTAEMKPYYLGSRTNADATTHPGQLGPQDPDGADSDHYVYDPRDMSSAELETSSAAQLLTDDSLVSASNGKQLVYTTAPFGADTEISGFFRLTAWISIDQPDTDLQVNMVELDPKGGVVQLSGDTVRARYRESLRRAVLIDTRAPLRYDFNAFTFVSRRVAAGDRLRLVIAPINSIYAQKNYNSGKPVSEQTLKDARPVTVTLAHDQAHPSALYIPLGQPE